MCPILSHNVLENLVHAEQGSPRAYDWVLPVHNSVKERDAPTLIQYLVVCRSKQAVGQTVPV